MKTADSLGRICCFFLWTSFFVFLYFLYFLYFHYFNFKSYDFNLYNCLRIRSGIGIFHLPTEFIQDFVQSIGCRALKHPRNLFVGLFL